MNKKIFHIHKIFYIFLCLIFSTSYSYAAPARNQWVNAPLACLPNRAVKWTTPAEMEPCHCPPQEYCGGLAPPKIKPSDIKFTVSLGYEYDPAKGLELYNGIQKNAVVTSFYGTDVPDIKSGKVTIQNILAAKDTQVQHGNNFLRNLLNDTVKRKTGIDMAHDWDNNPKILGPDWTTQNFIVVEIVNNTKSNDITNWIGKTRMPLSLVEQCCDVQLCPKGMYPEIVKQTLPKKYTPKTFLKAELDAATNAMVRYNAVYDSKRAVNSLTDAIATKISNIANTTITNKNIYLSDVRLYASFYNVTQDFARYLDYIKQNARLNGNASAKKNLEIVQKMSAELTSELKKRISTPKTHETTTLSCIYDVLIIREGCIRQGTKITLADGTKQPIENLNVGDSVKTQNGTAEIMAKSHFTQDIDYMFSINKGRAFFTVEHPILTTEGWKSVNPKVTSTKVTHVNIKGALKVGDILIREDGKNITVTSIDKFKLPDRPQAFNLSLSDKSSFYADGYLMKSFGQMQMHY